MKLRILLTVLIIAIGYSSSAQNLALTFENAEITNDGANDFYEVDVIATRISASDFKLGDGQFYVDYNPLAFGSGIGDAEVDFEYPPGSILAEMNVLAVYGTPVINANTATTVSIAWQQALSAGSMAANNITDTPTLLGHLKIQMINTAESTDICFNVAGPLFDDQFYTACGPFTPGVALRDCAAGNAGTQIMNYDGSDCSGSIIECTDTATYTAGGWVPSAPTGSSSVVISSNYDSSTDGGSIDACELTVDAGVVLTIAADDYLNVSNDITIEGTLNVAHTANVVQVDDDATVTNNGTINVFVNTPSLDGRDFILMGSPMSSESRADVFTAALRVRNHLTGNFTPNGAVTAASNGAGVWVDEEGDDWPVYNGAITPGEGYMVMRDLTGPASPLNLNFNTGTLNNGVVTYTAGYNGSQNASPNIIANPYASAISATDFINTNSNVDAVYFWEHITTPSSGIPGPYGLDYTMEDISIFNLTGGTSAAGSDPGTTPNGTISSGQGFGVKVTSAGDITFNNSMRRTSGNTTLRSTDDDRIWLNVQTDRYELNSTALIGFLPEATNAIDLGYDAKRLATNVALYSHLVDGSDQFGIQALGTFQEDVKVPMGFATLVDERINYTISIEDIQGLHLGNATAYLIDSHTNTITNLSETNYTFESEKGIYDNRFTLQFTPELILGNTDVSLETIAVYPNPTQDILNIASPVSEVKQVMIYDVRGRLVVTAGFSNKTVQLDLSELNSALYFVEITTQNGKVTKRITKQ